MIKTSRDKCPFDILILFTVLTALFSIFIGFIYPSDLGDVYPKTIIVEKGETIRGLAGKLRQENIIRSENLFILSTYLVGGKIKYGSYVLTEPKGIFFRAREFYNGSKIDIEKITVFRGENVYQIADKITSVFPDFDRANFIVKGLAEHGFLYPETYFFLKDEAPSADVVVNSMLKVFEAKTKHLFEEYKTGLTRKEILVLASIIELESYKPEDQKKIASVLYNRLKNDMPLQVDVALLFLNDSMGIKDRNKIDTKIDNRLNTYLYRGIPSIPFGNPSVGAIEAALDPEDTDYLYFLSDKNFSTYFTDNYHTHIHNIEKYLRNK